MTQLVIVQLLGEYYLLELGFDLLGVVSGRLQ